MEHRVSTLRVNTLTDVTGNTQPAMVGAAKAWVNFNGTGTVAIRRAFNVSSITDNGTGDYTVNFATALVDADYSAVVSGNLNVTTNSARWFCAPAFQAPTTTTIRIACNAPSTSSEDQQYVNVAIFR